MDGQQEFEKRLARLRDGMREKGLQTLLVYDSGRHNFLRMNYVAYLTDFISVGPETVLVVRLDDAPALYISPAWDISRAQEESWVSDIRPFKQDTIYQWGLAGVDAKVYAGRKQVSQR